MYENGDDEIYRQISQEIDKLERWGSISWREHMGDTARLSTLRKQKWELLHKMNNRPYNKELLASYYDAQKSD